MKPFISFRSEDFNGNYTLTFDGDSDNTRKLLRKLADMGALDKNSIEKLNQRGALWERKPQLSHYYVLLQDVNSISHAMHIHSAMNYI